MFYERAVLFFLPLYKPTRRAILQIKYVCSLEMVLQRSTRWRWLELHVPDVTPWSQGFEASQGRPLPEAACSKSCPNRQAQTRCGERREEGGERKRKREREKDSEFESRKELRANRFSPRYTDTRTGTCTGTCISTYAGTGTGTGTGQAHRTNCMVCAHVCVRQHACHAGNRCGATRLPQVEELLGYLPPWPRHTWACGCRCTRPTPLRPTTGCGCRPAASRRPWKRPPCTPPCPLVADRARGARGQQ